MCEQWEKFHYPCKHFFEVFNFYGDKWNFESLPSHYRHSVFITLDNEHMRVPSIVNEAASTNSDVKNVHSKGSR